MRDDRSHTPKGAPVTLDTVPPVDDPDLALRLDARKGITREEAEVLSVLREIRSEALEVKQRIRGLKERLDGEPDPRRAEAARRALAEEEARLASLREKWREWVKKREEAWRRRMVLLGHLEE